MLIPVGYNPVFKSPYYNESHRALRSVVRAFVENDLLPYIDRWEMDGEYPREIHEKAYKAGIYAVGL